jgi:hypothetical protein
MAIEHHRRIYRVVAGRMSLKGTGRIRALRTLFTLRNQHETDHGERVDSWMSAGPYSRKMTRARAALNGILEGSVRSPGVSKKNVG